MRLPRPASEKGPQIRAACRGRRHGTRRNSRAWSSTSHGRSRTHARSRATSDLAPHAARAWSALLPPVAGRFERSQLRGRLYSLRSLEKPELILTGSDVRTAGHATSGHGTSSGVSCRIAEPVALADAKPRSFGSALVGGHPPRSHTAAFQMRRRLLPKIGMLQLAHVSSSRDFSACVDDVLAVGHQVDGSPDQPRGGHQGCDLGSLGSLLAPDWPSPVAIPQVGASEAPSRPGEERIGRMQTPSVRPYGALGRLHVDLGGRREPRVVTSRRVRKCR